MPMQIVIASDQERDSVFAEIYDGPEAWAEISFDASGAMRLRVGGAEGPHGTSVDLDETLDTLREARRRLEGRWMGGREHL